MKHCTSARTLVQLNLQPALMVTAAAQTPAGHAEADGGSGTRSTIWMIRNGLEGAARRMAAGGVDPADTENMSNTMGARTARSGRSAPPPIDPTIGTLDCSALAARITQVDAAIEARIKTTTAAAGAPMATTSRMCTYGGPAACLAAGAIDRAGSTNMAAMAKGNESAVSRLDKMRIGFDPLLRERTTAVFYAERKAGK